MLIEQRKSFQITIVILSTALSMICWLILRPYIPKSDSLIQIAFTIILLAAIPGFMFTFKLLLPLIVSKIWPSLEGTGNTPKSESL